MKKPFSGKHRPVAALGILFTALCLVPFVARATWVPLRIALVDEYDSVGEWERKATNVYGIRIGLFESVNRNVYGLSVSTGFDGGSGIGRKIAPGVFRRSCVDDNFAGVKIGGVEAVANGSGAGFQIAGFSTRTDVAFTGFQIAGLKNETSFLSGVQIAGTWCDSTIEMNGIQLAGFLSHCGTHDPEASESAGIQLGGIAAVCDGAFSGVQIGTFYTEAHVLRGFQIGLVNYARTLKGFQIGLVNLCGDRDEGTLRGLPLLNAAF